MKTERKENVSKHALLLYERYPYIKTKKFVNILYIFLALCGFLKDNICNLQQKE
jgi:hypothetical protein